jgi:hypothetical protein
MERLAAELPAVLDNAARNGGKLQTVVTFTASRLLMFLVAVALKQIQALNINNCKNIAFFNT